MHVNGLKTLENKITLIFSYFRINKIGLLDDKFEKRIQTHLSSSTI